MPRIQELSFGNKGINKLKNRYEDTLRECHKSIEEIKAERERGIRLMDKRGYDVITDKFFVEESILDGVSNSASVKMERTIFDDFQSFFEYTEGKIYDKACYYQCAKTKFESLTVDYERIYSCSAFVSETIDDYCYTDKESEEIYAAGERTKKLCKKWFAKINECKTYDEFSNEMTKLKRSKLNAIVDSDVFCFDYIFSRPGDKNRFDIIIKYVLEHSEYNIAFALGHIFSPSIVVDAIENKSEVVKTEKSFKKELGVYFQYVRDGRIVSLKRAFFDNITHYYCEKTTFRRVGKKYEHINIYRYFETLDAFLKYRHGDLTNTDISAAPVTGYDFSNCRTDSTSKLPVTDAAMLDYHVMKQYIDRQYKVEQIWKNDSGAIIKNRKYVFDYFFDFVAFLNGDLSWADLVSCDGLANLVDITNINLDHAKITSSVSIKLGLPYIPYHPREEEAFDLPAQNERETGNECLTVRDSEIFSEKKVIADILREHANKQVNYISDIHLGHRLLQENVRSWNDVEYVIRNLVDDILFETKGMLLIDGDVASDFKVFKLFVQRLGERKGKKKVIFTLGNHELWDFADKTLNEIVGI